MSMPHRFRVGSTLVELVVACALISVLATVSVKSMHAQRRMLRKCEWRQLVITLAEDQLNRLVVGDIADNPTTTWQSVEIDDAVADVLGEASLEQRMIQTTLGDQVQVRVLLNGEPDTLFSAYTGLGS
ncbi:MAG: hypothetical protein AAF664_01710 [Planctomycetota bacterium]